LVDSVFALLFAAASPASSPDIAQALAVTEGQVEQALEILERNLRESGALMLVKIAGGWQLCTKPEFSEAIGAFLKPQQTKLSRSLMEVLAIVAYRQPITIAEVDAIRGVQSDYGIRQLLDRRLIQERGRKHVPGRPVIYGTTQQFLHQFNLNDLGDLPELENREELEPEHPSLFEESA
jgi:segregation and condensation protein B